MTRVLNLLLLLVSNQLLRYSTADNTTDLHSNETTVEFNATSMVLTTIVNTTDVIALVNETTKTISFADILNTTTVNDNVSSSTTFIDSTPFSTSVSIETKDASSSEFSTTVLEEHESATTTLIAVDETSLPTETMEESTNAVANTSCETSKFGCCLDGVTERSGPNNEGCTETDVNVTVSNITVAVLNGTDLNHVLDIENTTMKTENTDDLFNTSTTTIDNSTGTTTTTKTENATETATTTKTDNSTGSATLKIDEFIEIATTDVTFVSNEDNSTQYHTDQSTTDVFENTTAEVFESSTTDSVDISTASEVTDSTETTTENDTTDSTDVTTESETATTELTEVITESEPTTVRSNLCVDGEFECCPDGKTAAQGLNFEGCNVTGKLVISARNVSLQTVCELEKDAGSCSKYVNMWAYDRQQGKCIRFWYGSCEGNGNRFETEQQCQETCVSPKGIEVCLLPKMTGPCQSDSIRYYYDRDKKECQQFRYGGCNGNANNYETLEKCQSTCVKETVDQCTQPVEVGQCEGEFPRFYYDTITGQCRSFMYGGCKKNPNHFLALKDCLKTCVQPRQKDICLQPKVIGTCQERRPTWYFDLIERECKLFQYSGCKGNHNRFSSKEECDLSCFSLKTSKTLTDDIESLCNLPLARGNCDQQISRWYYNPTDQFCHSYQFTGCYGNANSFEIEQDCRQICQAKEKDICTLEKDTGTCDQYKIMWFHDSSTGQCKNFYYGSCGGNANRFGTEQECQLRCLIKSGNSTCFQQVDQGFVCNDTKASQNETTITTQPILKFFYDQQLRKCSSFLYHGCGGNDNRFDEENQCTDKCQKEVPSVEQGCGSNMIRCNIQCRFGFERDSNGCEICRCFEPCQRQKCPSGYECMIIPEQTPCVQVPCPAPRVECQPVTSDPTVDANGGTKPSIENSITNIFVQFDANVTIPCTLRQGHPAPVIYWYKERQQLQVHDAMTSGIIVRKIERLPDQSLLIRKVTLEDQGLYTCRAINEFGQDIKDVQLDIFDPIKVEIYPINRIYQLGFTAKLQCRATGYPLPRIVWMRDNIPLVNTTRVTLQHDGSLIIHPYKQEDAGPYVCNANNKKESVTQVAYLEVKETRVEPTCEDQPTFANCELVLRHNFCDVYFDYCCRTCSQHAQYSSTADKSSPPSSRNRRHVFSQ